MHPDGIAPSRPPCQDGVLLLHYGCREPEAGIEPATSELQAPRIDPTDASPAHATARNCTAIDGSSLRWTNYYPTVAQEIKSTLWEG
jgi:hypothetical protein